MDTDDRDDAPEKKQQDETTGKLPDTVAADQEWGERIESGKAVATGGQSATEERGTAPGKPDRDDEGSR